MGGKNEECNMAMNIVNPLAIERKDLPLIVFSDDLRGFFAWGIRVHSEGNYSHSMIMINEQKVISQGGTYSEVLINKYMNNRYRIKFWKIKNLSNEEYIDITNAVKKDLSANWWQKSYDWLGILGQLFKLRGINNPMQYYCSERIARYLRLTSIKDKIPLHPSPSQLNNLFKTIPEMEVFGYWESED